MSLQVLVFFLLALTTTVFSKSTRIIGAQNVNIGEFPYMAALIKISSNLYLCAGSIVSRRNILTAASCLYEYDYPLDNLKFVVGSTNFSSSSATDLFMDRVYIHPGFIEIKQTKIKSFRNDIALVRIKEVIEFNEYVGKIGLPRVSIYNGEVGLLSGWGTTSYPEEFMSQILQKVWMTVLDKEYCFRLYPIPIENDQFCGIQKKGVGICTGDAGSPLIAGGIIFGIASTYVPCATGFPDVYTNVFNHINFIRHFLIE